MVGISGDILPWIDHLLFKVLRSRPKINLSMFIKKKKKEKRMGIRIERKMMRMGRGKGEGVGKVWLSEEKKGE
jgi:hypothetical protein